MVIVLIVKSSDLWHPSRMINILFLSIQVLGKCHPLQAAKLVRFDKGQLNCWSLLYSPLTGKIILWFISPGPGEKSSIFRGLRGNSLWVICSSWVYKMVDVSFLILWVSSNNKYIWGYLLPVSFKMFLVSWTYASALCVSKTLTEKLLFSWHIH